MKQFVCTAFDPVVETKEGKLRGFRYGEIYHFLGIKYANARRFRMPERVTPWEGVKDALQFGEVCPLIEPEKIMDDITIPHRCWAKNEDCQYLNVWTPTLDSGAKKPVLVWIHGGGYTAGSSIELVAYDGENLAEFGDIVVVSLNHRLNLLGYLDLSSYGERYWNTANLGQADIVTALEWVRDNISRFGGDPDKVTVYGQSGGGGKVHSLLQTPAADDLFRGAIIQSGMWREFGFTHGDPGEQRELAEAMIAHLGGSGPECLETAPYDALAGAYRAVVPALADRGIRTGLAPLPNDWYLGSSLDRDFTAAALRRPVLVGTTFGEFNCMFMPQKDKYRQTEEEKMAAIRNRFGDNAQRVLSLFRRAYPEKDISDCVMMDSFFRAPALEFCEKRAAMGSQNTFAYVHTPDYTYNGGAAAWHSADIVYAFHNMEKVPVAHIPCGERLQEQTAGAWVNFVRTGDPSHPSLPKWRPYTAEDRATMVLNEDSGMRVDFDRELVALLEELVPFPRRGGQRKG